MRYEIRDNQVYKKQDNDPDWRVLDHQEAENFHRATQAYRHSVLTKLYPERDWRQL